MLLSEVYDQFNLKCTTATSLIGISNVFFDNQVNYANEFYSSDIHACVINGAFLMMFMAFEEFLEKSFICYMLGQSGVNNKTFLSFVNPKSDEHAYKILRGLSSYPDFTNRETILKLANNFFENGGTYIVLDTFGKTFDEIKKIRNAITHISLESAKNFFDMVRLKIGALPTGYDTVIFLNSVETDTNFSYFIYYRDHMKYVVDAIANPT